MGILRYLVQGFGWELGATAARESVDAVRRSAAEADAAERQAALPPTKKELARLEKAKHEAEKQRLATIERKKAEIEAELARLKKMK